MLSKPPDKFWSVVTNYVIQQRREKKNPATSSQLWKVTMSVHNTAAQFSDYW